jgi:ornithine carbamoyltransferase
VKGVQLCFVGDGNNVARSLMFAGARTGMNVRVVSPAGYTVDTESLALARREAEATGARIELTSDLAGVGGADVIYTDVWASMGQEAEAQKRKEAFRGFQVDGRLMKRAQPDAIFMHCLPAHRGEEVAAEVIDGPQSVVFDEAENRLHAQKALLDFLVNGAGKTAIAAGKKTAKSKGKKKR